MQTGVEDGIGGVAFYTACQTAVSPAYRPRVWNGIYLDAELVKVASQMRAEACLRRHG